MKITQKHIDIASKAGACSINYYAGQNVQEVSESDLKWFEEFCHRESVSVARQIIKTYKSLNILGVPWLLNLFFPGSSSSYGDGYGSGDGSGYGSGSSSSYGDGYGSGDGYGYGDGSGSGDGYGY